MICSESAPWPRPISSSLRLENRCGRGSPGCDPRGYSERRHTRGRILRSLRGRPDRARRPGDPRRDGPARIPEPVPLQNCSPRSDLRSHATLSSSFDHPLQIAWLPRVISIVDGGLVVLPRSPLCLSRCHWPLTAVRRFRRLAGTGGRLRGGRAGRADKAVRRPQAPCRTGRHFRWPYLGGASAAEQPSRSSREALPPQARKWLVADTSQTCIPPAIITRSSLWGHADVPVEEGSVHFGAARRKLRQNCQEGAGPVIRPYIETPDLQQPEHRRSRTCTPTLLC